LSRNYLNLVKEVFNQPIKESGVIVRYKNSVKLTTLISVKARPGMIKKTSKKTIRQFMNNSGILIRLLLFSGFSLLGSLLIFYFLEDLKVSEVFLLILAIISAILSLFFLYIRRLIIKPLNEVIKTTGSIAKGQLGLRIDVKNDNELGQLAAKINIMTESLQHRLSQLSTLCEISRDTTSKMSLQDVLDLILIKAVNFHQADSGSIMLLDDKTDQLEIKASINIEQNIIDDTKTKIGEGIAGWVAKEGKPLLLMDGVTITGNRDLKDAVSIPIMLKEKVLGVLNLNNQGSKPHAFNTKDLDFLTALSSQAATVINNAQLFEKLKDNYLSVIQALAAAIDAKDSYTHGHSARVAKYAVAVAKELGLPPEEIDDIEAAAYLHDVGKIGIPEKILVKPSRLTEEEFKIIKTHPEISARILAPVEFKSTVIPAVLHHHEHYNGRGYPDNLKGEQIPFEARIMAVADSYDAMTTNRPYRPPRDISWARQELARCAGSQFDPQIVKAFLKVLENITYRAYVKPDDKVVAHK